MQPVKHQPDQPSAAPAAACADVVARGRVLAAELARYFGASFVALVVDVMVLVVATEVFGLHYLLAATLGFAAGIVVVYELSVRWVFAHRSIGQKPMEMTFFLFTGVVGLGLTALIVFLLTEHAALHYGVSKFGAAGVVFTFNFGVRKLALFRAPRPIPGEVPHVS